MRIAEILKAFQSTFYLNASLSDALPGGFHSGTPKQMVDRPYAILTVEDLGREFTSGRRAIGRYRVNIKVYGVSGMSTMNNIGIQLTNLFDFNRCKIRFTDSNVLIAIPDNESLEVPEENPTNTDDVLIFNTSWIFTINESQLTNY